MSVTEIKPGDILAFTGEGFVSALINLGSFGIPGIHASHVGIVAEHADRGLFVFESTMIFGGNRPCRITGKKQDGVRAVYLEDVFTRPGRIYHYPLRVALSPYARYRLAAHLESVLGVRYDIRGAARSGGFFLRSFFELLFKSDLTSIYCSELTDSAHSYAGVLESVRRFRSPNAFLRGERRQAVLLKPIRLK